ncbi:MAG TPA: autoinducer binding domain-containing protein [Rhodanobacteraceae bacterium]|nr:autoinducer binding domain-containing protein [Rhodanobacteraceae bacterium]
MENWREDCLGRLSPEAGPSAALFKKLGTITAELGFEYCSYVLKSPVPVAQPRVAWWSNYPDRWLDRYFSNNYLDIDPLIQQTSRSMRPLAWASESQEVQPQFWEEARANGIRYGWAMSTCGPDMTTGMLSLARSDEAIAAAELNATEMKLVWLAHVMHELVSTAEMGASIPESACHLTDRECEVLRWSAAGKTVGEVSKILGIADRTVTFHVTSSLCKLDVTNKTQAVAKALLLRLI